MGVGFCLRRLDESLYEHVYEKEHPETKHLQYICGFIKLTRDSSCVLLVTIFLKYRQEQFTFNFIPWWIEPFTAFPLVGLLALIEIFGKNPLYWWPLFWGTKIQIKHIDDNPVKHTFDADELIQKLGGPANVYMVNWETLKFRRKKDITKYVLFTSLDRPDL